MQQANNVIEIMSTMHRIDMIDTQTLHTEVSIKISLKASEFSANLQMICSWRKWRKRAGYHAHKCGRNWAKWRSTKTDKRGTTKQLQHEVGRPCHIGNRWQYAILIPVFQTTIHMNLLAVCEKHYWVIVNQIWYSTFWHSIGPLSGWVSE